MAMKDAIFFIKMITFINPFIIMKATCLLYGVAFIAKDPLIKVLYY